MAKYLYGRRVKLVLLTPHESVTFDYKQTETHSMGIQFNVPFSDSSTPPTCTVTIMNLAAKHRKLFKKGYEVKLYAGYAEDGVGLLSAGVIRAISPFTSDGTNNTFSFTYREGQEYSKLLSSAEKANKKADEARKKKAKVIGKKSAAGLPKIKKNSALSFGKNTAASTIIRRIASDAGITLSKVYLAKSKKYKKGYAAHGKPITNIKAIAKACGSKVYYRRGSIVIDDLSKVKGHNEHILVTEHVKGRHGGTGLIQYPTTDSDSMAKHKTWTVTSLLRYQVSTGSVVTVENRFLKGTFRVKSGEHVCDDSAFTTAMEVYV
ncbi:hypothetical protein DA477_09315 [Levilactobacillus brevis]|uniref:phage protein n=1 Tax=Levilactobacillus brevis TaxID=1580 RepID=UPI000D35A379|nr:hypothetical protein [Levilactobacillus brevis]PUD96091.1 hypothetical protein DA477_09315 [Levilactobacillus brevis]